MGRAKAPNSLGLLAFTISAAPGAKAQDLRWHRGFNVGSSGYEIDERAAKQGPSLRLPPPAQEGSRRTAGAAATSVVPISRRPGSNRVCPGTTHSVRLARRRYPTDLVRASHP
jgi:hypothetical protein